jgi:histidinol dehydrogenase
VLQNLDLRKTSPPYRLPRPELADEPVDVVRNIIAEVRERGDLALRDLTERFDGVSLEALRVPDAELESALRETPAELRAALEAAAEAIADFHRQQLVEPSTYQRGGLTIREWLQPLARAGCYVPGGLASYPSTVLMTAVVARVAGVEEVVVCVPPGPAGSVPRETLAAAAIAGVDEVFAVGGAQAIAALAYGTESVRAVDAIVGPGNRFVAVAKREVAGTVSVPSAFAGPSEIVVVADESTPIEFAAIDLIVQAEHGPSGLSWLVTWSESVAEQIGSEIARLLENEPRRDAIVSTLSTAGYVALVDGPAAAAAVVNQIAPEHLQLMQAEPEGVLAEVRNAGAIFVGTDAPASLGDYIAGPSHVLPTAGTARFSGALGVADFCKPMHVISVTPDGLREVAPHIEAIATSEGLHAHARSVRMRLDRQ